MKTAALSEKNCSIFIKGQNRWTRFSNKPSSAKKMDAESFLPFNKYSEKNFFSESSAVFFSIFLNVYAFKVLRLSALLLCILCTHCQWSNVLFVLMLLFTNTKLRDVKNVGCHGKSLKSVVLI